MSRRRRKRRPAASRARRPETRVAPSQLGRQPESAPWATIRIAAIPSRFCLYVDGARVL